MSEIGSVMLMCHLTCQSWLPARLHDAGDLPAHRDLAQLVAPQPEFAEYAARTPGQRAAVAQPRRARVTRQSFQLAARSGTVLVRDLGVVHDREQLGALLRVLLHDQAPLLVAVDDCGFGHWALSS